MRRKAFAVYSGLVCVALAAVCGIWTRPGRAADYSKFDWKKRFDELDKNRDDKVTTKEWAQSALFRLIDADGNGEITRDEARKFFEKGSPQPAVPPAATAEESAGNKAADVVPAGKGPRVLPASARSVGRLVPDIEFRDIEDKPHRLSEYKDRAVVVVAMTSTTCPLSQKFLPSLAKLEREYAAARVQFVYVNSIPTEKPAELRELAGREKLAGPYVHDAKEEFARAVGATSTTDVIVLDGARTVLYQGCVDDQYGLGYSLSAPRTAYLSEALDAILLGMTPVYAATTAPGCVMDTDEVATKTGVAETGVTYHERVARIVRQACVECHHDGGVGPFALTTLDDLKAHKGMIRQVVEQGTMPPWFAAPAQESGAGKSGAENAAAVWRNDRSLSSADKRDLLAWLNSDMPEGDPANGPLPYAAPGHWSLGTPDLVVRLPQPIAIPATGTMPYQNVAVETGLTEDKWVSGMEVRPTNRGVVHHVLVFVIPPGSGEAGNRDGDDDERRGFFAAYVPGATATRYPDGFAKFLPKGSRLRFQLHYTPNGSAAEDRTELALTFADHAPRHEVKVTGIVDPMLRIPPGAANHEEGATLRVPADAKLLGLMPHMHVRGKAFRYELVDATGKTETLLDIPRYDFNWQLGYVFAQPKDVPAGSTLKATGWFDNSTGNAANPDPTKTVKWGPQTDDEMLIGYVEYYLPGGEPGAPTASFGKIGGAGLIGQIEKVFREVDENQDLQITRAEFERIGKFAPRLAGNKALMDGLFARLDKDGDGMVTTKELQRLRE
jgi:thiol-disulfide isomerase/thioredoxin/mono/diheme cytochrome c family protein